MTLYYSILKQAILLHGSRDSALLAVAMVTAAAAFCGTFGAFSPLAFAVWNSTRATAMNDDLHETTNDREVF